MQLLQIQEIMKYISGIKDIQRRRNLTREDMLEIFPTSSDSEPAGGDRLTLFPTGSPDFFVGHRPMFGAPPALSDSTVWSSRH